MSSRAAFAKLVPDGYFLDASDREGLTRHLREQRWIGATDQVRAIEPAGDGNMNCTVRVSTDEATFILKQSRPWVEKYPLIAAPVDRALQEGSFYELVAENADVAGMMPRLLGMERSSRLLMLADLGPASDYTSAYTGAPIDAVELDALLGYLSALHGGFRVYEQKDAFANRDMRRLNHQHMFEIPLSPQGPGVDLDSLTPGLGDAAASLIRDGDYRASVERLGQRYLATGPALLHGDFFPGSWVKAGGAVWVIDPEFCFFGPSEFDVGVLLAHLYLAKQPRPIVHQVVERYRSESQFDRDLAARFAGVEMMRRLLGVAQLPLTATLADKEQWLRQSQRLVSGRDPWGEL